MSVIDEPRDIKGVTHYPTFRRRNLGMSIPWNRPLYGTRVECRCGWQNTGNEDKHAAESDYRWHLRELREASIA